MILPNKQKGRKGKLLINRDNSSKSLLVLGSDQACHSKMIAALLRHITFSRINVQATHLEKDYQDSFARKVMQELGINIENENSRPVNEFVHSHFDIIITTTMEAREKILNMGIGSTKIFKEFPNPQEEFDDELDIEAGFRELRDQMQEWLNEFVVRHRLAPQQ